jgi:hypothetical protein
MHMPPRTIGDSAGWSPELASHLRGVRGLGVCLALWVGLWLGLWLGLGLGLWLALGLALWLALWGWHGPYNYR